MLDGCDAKLDLRGFDAISNSVAGAIPSTIVEAVNGTAKAAVPNVTFCSWVGAPATRIGDFAALRDGEGRAGALNDRLGSDGAREICKFVYKKS